MSQATRSNLTMRLITAAIGAPLVIFLIWLSPYTATALLLIVFGLALLEYHHVIQHGDTSPLIYMWGFIYLGLSLFLALWLRFQDNGALLLLLVVLVNWMTDTCAYTAGRIRGKTPLAPRISPNKTWEGAIGGVIGGFLTTFVLTAVFQKELSIVIILIGILTPISTIIGDLLESAFKRHYGVKDSGFLLPGHGGILDRIDGTLLAIPAAALLVWLLG